MPFDSLGSSTNNDDIDTQKAADFFQYTRPMTDADGTVMRRPGIGPGIDKFFG
jgi:hypothetical protein